MLATPAALHCWAAARGVLQLCWQRASLHHAETAGKLAPGHAKPPGEVWLVNHAVHASSCRTADTSAHISTPLTIHQHRSAQTVNMFSTISAQQHTPGYCIESHSSELEPSTCWNITTKPTSGNMALHSTASSSTCYQAVAWVKSGQDRPAQDMAAQVSTHQHHTHQHHTRQNTTATADDQHCCRRQCCYRMSAQQHDSTGRLHSSPPDLRPLYALNFIDVRKAEHYCGTGLASTCKAADS